MANIFDYMIWRGDLPFMRDPLNDIDSLIINRIAYIPFDGIISDKLPDGLTVGEAVQKFLAYPDADKRVYIETDIRLCRAILDCPRFALLPLSGYENTVDTKREVQFCAMVFSLSPTEHYIAFRGTDNTIVGWKEDFNMSFVTPVPAQLQAARYLEKAAAGMPGSLITGGHSKGGNLAVYAAAYASSKTRNRISAIYNNDGPGFDPAVLKTDGYLAISAKIRTFVPQSSIVGMLLEHEEDYTIVKSKQVSIMQHDLYSWEVLGREFISLDRVTNSSRFIDSTLKDWVSHMTRDQRERFVDGLFSLLRDTNAETLQDLTENFFVSAKTIIKTLGGMDEETRSSVQYALGLLLRSAKENISEVWPKPKLPGRKGEVP
ncbi:MAG: DUF2974 domain-containing protein [Oscillospiraceae bacterium]